MKAANTATEMVQGLNRALLTVAVSFVFSMIQRSDL